MSAENAHAGGEVTQDRAVPALPVVIPVPAGAGEPPKLERAPRSWSKAQKAAIVAYVALVQEALRLRDWTVTVDLDHWAPEALASMSNSPNQKHATLRLGRGFRKLSPAIQSQTIVHELVHCHLFGVHNTAESMFETMVSGKVAVLAQTVMVGQIEAATDALADALAGLLPVLELPPR